MINKKNKALDLGSGNDKTPGAISLDFSENFDPDVVHNLNIFPYPFKSNQFNEVNIKDVLFLLNDPSKMRMLNFKHCEPIEKLNNSDTQLKKMYLTRDIYNLLKILDDILQVMKYKDSLKDYKNKYDELEYNEFTHPSNNKNKVSDFFKKYPDLTNKKILDGIKSEILGIIDKLGRNELPS